MDFIPKNCPACGMPKNALQEDKEIIKRCKCDWRRGFQTRLVRTTDKAFFAKNLLHWRPRLFLRPCTFYDLIKAQKATALIRLHEFGWRKSGPTSWSIARSIAGNRNLFIRGPQNSGRGLLMAAIKTWAAAKDITVTPLPGQFDTFRNDVSQAEALGSSGDATRALVRANYVDVEILALENLRQESIIKVVGAQGYSVAEHKARRKFRSSNMVDDILARRQSRPGSIVLTSYDFAGEIADTLGDGLAEMLNSPNTGMVMLFSPAEVDSLGLALKDRKRALSGARAQLMASAADKSLSGKAMHKTNIEHFDEMMYFDEAFKSLAGIGGHGSGVDPSSMAKSAFEANDMHPDVVKRMVAFNASREAKDSMYIENMRKTYVSAVKGVFADRMTEKEMETTGRLLGLATNREWLDDMVVKAKECRADMVTMEQE